MMADSTKQPRLSGEAYVLLALDALKFTPGDWTPDSVDRHLREQIAMAEARLNAYLDNAEPLYLVFADWQAGHDGVCPEPLPVVDQAHAERILEALSRCVTQGCSFAAKLSSLYFDLEHWSVCDDHFVKTDDSYWTEAGIAPGWKEDIDD